MSYENWKDRIGTFEVMDVRGKKMDFFPALKAKAAALKNGEGLHIGAASTRPAFTTPTKAREKR